MKKYTLEELKQTKTTVMKYIIAIGNLTMSNEDIERAKEFYKKNSKSKYKRKRLGEKSFKRMFKKELDVYNNRIK